MANGFNAEQMERLAKVIDGEFAQAVENAMKTLSDDINVRMLAVTGKDTEAEKLRMKLAQEEEYRNAKAAGVSEEILQKLLDVQQREYAKQFTATGEAQPETTSANAHVNITEVSAGRLIDVGMKSERWLAQIAGDIRRQSGGTSGPGGIKVEVSGTVNTTSSDGRPATPGQVAGQKIGRDIDKQLGFFRRDEQRRLGSSEA
jgi:hypothetical protein